jgi:hypothetical protein
MEWSGNIDIFIREASKPRNMNRNPAPCQKKHEKERKSRNAESSLGNRTKPISPSAPADIAHISLLSRKTTNPPSPKVGLEMEVQIEIKVEVEAKHLAQRSISISI